METYRLIIKNIIKTDINFFALDYKEDKLIKWYIKLSFMLLQKLTSTRDKYKLLYDILNGFLLKDKIHQNEFMDYFCKIQKIYNTLNRVIYNYKYKKSKIVVNTDMCLNELREMKEILFLLLIIIQNIYFM